MYVSPTRATGQILHHFLFFGVLNGSSSLYKFVANTVLYSIPVGPKRATKKLPRVECSSAAARTLLKHIVEGRILETIQPYRYI